MSKVARKIKGIADAHASKKAGLALSHCSGTQLAEPTPPEVAALQAAKNAFDAAVTDQLIKRRAAAAATQLKKQRRAELEQAYNRLGDLVQELSQGDAEKISLRGFARARGRSPLRMEQVTELVVSPGANAGEVNWRCKPQNRAIYLIEISEDVNPRVWIKQEPSLKAKGGLAGLPSVSRLWVRVAAKGAHNTGGWSDPALVVVP